MKSTLFGKRTRPVGVVGIALATVVALALLCPSTTEAKFTLKDSVGENEMKLQIYGFSQLEARGGDGWALRPNVADNGLTFNAQRIRMGFNYFHGPIAGKLFLDFNQSFASDEAGLFKMIKDAFVAYRWNDAAFIRLGMIKTPLGMDFTVPGWNLDIIERNGLEKGLVLERDFGLMLSGRLIGQGGWAEKPMKTNGLEMGNERQGYGFGYDLMVGNPSGRSSSVTWNGGAVRGDALAYIGRVHFDWGKTLHAEAAYGISEKAGGLVPEDDPPSLPDPALNEDYEVWDVGVSSELMDSRLELKLEFISGNNIRGVRDWKQTTGVFTAGFLFIPSLEGVIKTYQSESDRPGAADKTELGNTYIGLNWFLARVSEKHRDLQRHKIVINYILVNGDDVSAETEWNGLGGYRDDAWGVQWQYKF
jgi:hypothetical protein